jgi:putative FmdB family regulatory protein
MDPRKSRRQTSALPLLDRGQSTGFSATILAALSGEAPMPLYDYVCNDCHKTFELVLTLKQHDTEIKCPKCGSRNIEQEATAFYAVTGKKS